MNPKVARLIHLIHVIRRREFAETETIVDAFLFMDFSSTCDSTV